MKKYVTKRRVALLAGLAVAASFAVAGYAYFTNNGSGTGSASVGDSSGIVITNDNQSADLFPGGPAVTVDLHLNNPGAGNQYVGTVSGTVEDNSGCLGSWFTVAPNVYNAEVNAGATNDTSTTITMADSGTDQDACKDAAMTINWTSN